MNSLHRQVRTLCTALLLLLLTPSPARAADPNLVWRTIETPHFYIHYHSEVSRLAQRLAVVTEHAYDRISRALDHKLKYKLDVVIIDTTDDVNGFAYAFPYPHVTLLAAAPDDRSELNDYDDYLTHVFIHEYTHIIHIDTVHSLWRWANWLLGLGGRGRVFVPNAAQPTFIIEGLAVVEESEYTSGGRLRSSIYDMWLRTAALEGKFMRLDQIANYPRQFPRGGAPYLYGSAFLRYIAARFGPNTLTRLSHEYGSSWIPGGINRALRRVTGHTFAEIYPDFVRTRVERYQKQAAAIRAEGETPSLVLTAPREGAHRPTFTRDGKEVVWADSDMYTRPRFRRLAVPPDIDAAIESAIADNAKAKPRYPDPGTVAKVDGAGGSVFSPDGKTFYFDAIDVWRTNYFYSDLWAIDVPSGERRRITDGARANEPDLSPDGTTLACVLNEGGSRALAIVPTAGTIGGSARPTRLLGNRDELAQVYTPSWSPDGKRLAFSWWRQGGYRDLYVIDVATRETERLTFDRALDVDPRWSPDGKYIYFSSDRTGVYNLYAYELSTRRTWQVTNVIGGAFDVALSPDGRRAVYVGFQADGWRLEAITLDPRRWREAPAQLLDRPDADTTLGYANLPSRPYQPWASAWPRVLSGTSYPNAFGQVFALQLTGGDAVGFHGWAATLGFGTGRADDISASVAYYYTRLFPSFSFYAARGLARRGGYFVDGIERPYVEDDYTASASVSFPILRAIGQSSDISFGYNFAYLRNADNVRPPLDPNHLIPRLPETGQYSTIGLGWYWSNARRYTFSNATEEGRALSFSLNLSLRAIGSSQNVYTASWRWIEFISFQKLWSFLPPDYRLHTLSVSYGGGVSGGDARRRGTYYLGGYAPQPDPLRSLVDFTRPGGAALRGYPWASIYGDQFHSLNLEYHFPIAYIERGHTTSPIYLRRLHGALFTDIGNAFYGPFKIEDFKVGVGGELRLELSIAYVLPISLQLGYAHGFMKGGEDQFYFLLNNPF